METKKKDGEGQTTDRDAFEATDEFALMYDSMTKEFYKKHNPEFLKMMEDMAVDNGVDERTTEED